MKALALFLFPIAVNATTLVSDPVDSRATHCGIYQDSVHITSSPVAPTALGNICSYAIDTQALPLGRHVYRATAEVLDSNGVITNHSALSLPSVYLNKPAAPTGLKVK